VADKERVVEKVKEREEEEEHDDYVNASHVQPLGTRRRYIATQGPLEATFGDFWT
jgi:protein-tyrosine phosphatase